MSTKKKGLLSVSGEWAKHLRSWGKKSFWKTERAKEKELLIKEKNEKK